MSYLRARWPSVIAALYLCAVFACVPLAFDFKGQIDSNWILVLILLTLPWGLVSVLFAWSLFHGAGPESFAFLHLVFAGVNAFILYYGCSALRRYFGKSRPQA